MNFASDNVYGVHPKIMAALEAANRDATHKSYGYDDLTKRAEEKLAGVFGCDLRMFCVATGTAANGLALSAMVPPYGAVFCHAEAHIAVDECNSPELFTGGAKIIGVHSGNGKIAPAQIERALKGFNKGEHDPKPAAVSITVTTELGTVYSVAEVKALSALAKAKGMGLHMDGARFANAVAALGCAPADISWKAGVDALSFGATKNGAMFLEAVVFFDLKLAEDFTYRRMRGGQLFSKTRYQGAQMLAYLADGLWLENARRANGLAKTLSEGLAKKNSVRIPLPTQANEVFAVLPRALHEKLQAAGAVYYDWSPECLGPGGLAEDEVFVRFVLSFATPEEDVEALLKL
jgi:threonine aldolase